MQFADGSENAFAQGPVQRNVSFPLTSFSHRLEHSRETVPHTYAWCTSERARVAYFRLLKARSRSRHSVLSFTQIPLRSYAGPQALLRQPPALRSASMLPLAVAITSPSVRLQRSQTRPSHIIHCPKAARSHTYTRVRGCQGRRPRSRAPEASPLLSWRCRQRSVHHTPRRTQASPLPSAHGPAL